MAIQQNNDSVAVYYGRMKRIWDELQVLQGYPDCTCGALKECTCNILKKVLEDGERMKLIQFLHNLNTSFDSVKVNILGSDPLPTVNRAYHILQQVERQQSNMMSIP